MLASATPSPPGHERERAGERDETQNTTRRVGERRRRAPSPCTQTQAARHSKNQDAASHEAHRDEQPRRRAAPRSPRCADQPRRTGRAGASGREQRDRDSERRACTTTRGSAPGRAAGRRAPSSSAIPSASVTRSASTIGAERATGTPYERRRSPDFSSSPSFAGRDRPGQPCEEDREAAPRRAPRSGAGAGRSASGRSGRGS